MRVHVHATEVWHWRGGRLCVTCVPHVPFSRVLSINLIHCGNEFPVMPIGTTPILAAADAWGVETVGASGPLQRYPSLLVQGVLLLLCTITTCVVHVIFD